jgi:N-methylhydantoinase B
MSATRIPDGKPIMLEIVANALASITDEMTFTVVRTAHSAIVKDIMDFSVALCDPRGRMVVQGLSLPLHLGAIPHAVTSLLEHGPALRPDDVVIFNDPYQGGMHLPDIFMFKPIFAGVGDAEPIAFSVVVAHQVDIGGRVPGGNAADSTEIYQEGLRLGFLKYRSQGELNHTLIEVIRRNVRVPDQVLGDLNAQYAACCIGEKGLKRLIEHYGEVRLGLYVEELLDYSERLARKEILEWPDGVYTFVDFLDDDGIEAEPVRLEVSVNIKGDEVEVDFTGSSDQVRGAINCTASVTKSIVWAVARCLMSDRIPNNDGYFRPFSIEIPRGSVLDATYPAATAARAGTAFRLADAMFGAFASAVPKAVPAAGEGGFYVISIGGYSESKEPFVMVDALCGSWGGRPTKDGVDGVGNPVANCSNTPAEVIELELPVRVEEYAYVCDTEGAGRFRGGLAVVRSFRLLEREAVLQVRADRQKFPPWGLSGGQPGARATTNLERAGESRPLNPKVTMAMKNTDCLRVQTAGGGGHGDPLSRDPIAVLQDVCDGKVTRSRAEMQYGVVLENVEDLAVDFGATQAQRKTLAEKSARSIAD